MKAHTKQQIEDNNRVILELRQKRSILLDNGNFKESNFITEMIILLEHNNITIKNA
jgi:hypothetical protein